MTKCSIHAIPFTLDHRLFQSRKRVFLFSALFYLIFWNYTRAHTTNMAAAKLPNDVRDMLESAQESVDILSRQVKGRQFLLLRHWNNFNFCGFSESKATPISALPPSSGCEFHMKLVSTSQLVSRECTKMAILFSRPPAPSLDECGCVCRQLEQATCQLVTTLYQVNRGTHGT